jgi:hypothetical protein
MRGYVLIAGLLGLAACTASGTRMTPAQLAEWQAARSACNAIDMKLVSRSVAIAKNPNLSDKEKAAESAQAMLQDSPEVQAADLAALAKCDANRSATIAGALQNLQQMRDQPPAKP